MTNADVTKVVFDWLEGDRTADLLAILGWTQKHAELWRDGKMSFATIDAGPRDADGAPCEAT